MTLGITGCASPGPPLAPSLQLPQPVTTLLAERRGMVVNLQFRVPTSTSEGLPYRGGPIRVTVCRAVAQGSCLPVPGPSGGASAPLPSAGLAADNEGVAHVQEVLAADLGSGPARLLTYRLQLSNGQGRSAGYGDAAYAAAGAAPEPVAGLRAQGSREGVVLRWEPAGASRGEVVLERTALGPAGANVGPGIGSGGQGQAATRVGAKPASQPGSQPSGGRTSPTAAETGQDAKGVVWLRTTVAGDPLAHPIGRTDAAPDTAKDLSEAVPAAGRSGPSPNGVLDDSAVRGAGYLYAAEREQTVVLGGHTLVLHSVLSAPVQVTLLAAYPPRPPTDLAAAAYPSSAGGPPGTAVQRAVDLIWTPADEPTPTYFHVYREREQPDGSWGPRVRLTEVPVGGAAFHDVLPPALTGAGRLRYSVTAVNQQGMQSAPVATTVTLGGTLSGAP